MSTIHSWRMEDHLKLMHTGGPCWICSLEKWALWALGPYGRPKLFADISAIHQLSHTITKFWYVFGKRWGRVRSEKSNVSNFILIAFWPYWTLPISGMLPWGPAGQKKRSIDAGIRPFTPADIPIGNVYYISPQPQESLINSHLYTYIDPVKVLKYLQVELGTWNVKMGSFNQA